MLFKPVLVCPAAIGLINNLANDIIIIIIIIIYMPKY